MNGAQSLLQTLADCGVEICFTNPGTTEIQFLVALDRIRGMRSIPALFEGVVSGAADGYARMTDKPAATLLHLGPGLANALANLHNARRARVPIVNIIGDHASYHKACDPPLHSDIPGFSRPVSGWIETLRDGRTIPEQARAAVAAALAPPGQIATLIVPADLSWGDAAEPPATDPALPVPARVDDERIRQAAAVLRSGEPAALILKDRLLRGPGLALADCIRAATGARVLCDTFNARIERGAGRAGIEYLPYFPESILEMLTGLRHLILAGARPPAGFFAYRGLPESLLPDGCETLTLSTPDQDGGDALERLAQELGADTARPALTPPGRPELPRGDLDPESIARSVGALLPDHAIVVDEAISSSMPLVQHTRGAPPHDWLFNTGGAIGIGLPLALGAAVACPDRRVLCLAADGSSMYTLQALWTYARESLDITTVIYANRAYRILQIEYHRLGVGQPGAQAAALMDLTRPGLDWTALAAGMGVPATRVTDIDGFNRVLAAYLREPGPNLVEAVF